MKVSIIIPIYNAANFIRDCLNSIVSQTMTEGVECILVDDCGQDDSICLAEKVIYDYLLGNIGKEKNNISAISSLSQEKIIFNILHQAHNQGPSAARNRGIREATGEYIFFLDADDQITPKCIETLYSIAKQNNADYVQGTYKEKASPHPSPVGREFGLPQFLDNKKEIKSLLLNYNKIQFTPHNRLVRRQMILDHDLFFNEQIKVREDFLWMTFVAKYVNRFAATPVETYVRGFNEDSLTHNINIEREIQGYRVLIETMCDNIDPFLKGRQKNLILEALLMALRAGYYDDREYLIDKVKSVNTFFERSLINLYFKTSNNLLLRIIQKYYSIQK